MVDQVSSLETRSAQPANCVALLYHDVVLPGQFGSSGFSGADADVYKFERPEFEQHLEAIAQVPHRGDIGLLHDASSPIRPGTVLLTFDDAGASTPSIAAMLESFGWRGHFFVPTDFIGKPGFMTAIQIRELHARGHAVGSHSCSHPTRMALCKPAELKREWTESVRVLAAILDSPVRIASVPGGYYLKSVAHEAAAAGIEVLFNSEPITRPQRVSGCLVVGRFSIRQGVSADTAARIAGGDFFKCTEQYLYWNAKKLAKRLGGDYYLSLRKAHWNGRHKHV